MILEGLGGAFLSQFAMTGIMARTKATGEMRMLFLPSIHRIFEWTTFHGTD